jgi:hypothetical protein
VLVDITLSAVSPGRARAFDAALERTLGYAAGAFALGFLLSFALPTRARRDEPAEPVMA